MDNEECPGCADWMPQWVRLAHRIDIEVNKRLTNGEDLRTPSERELLED